MLYNESTLANLTDYHFRPDTGCLAQLQACTAASAGDPLATGANATVNRICGDANHACDTSELYVAATGRNYYDIAQDRHDPFPPQYCWGYLNRPHVQRALGVPLNFTQSSRVVSNDFSSTADLVRSDGPRTYLRDLADVLAAGTRVALVYGDRDWICNWVGGENVSLQIPFPGQDAFRAAGYADLVVNASYTGGLTREVGNLSFSRVFQAGHEVPAYQPGTALAIFNRTMHGLDIATGRTSIASGDEITTAGPNDTLAVRQAPPPMLPPTCYLYDLPDTCSAVQREMVLNGSGLLDHYVLIDANHTGYFPPVPVASAAAAAVRTGPRWSWEGPWLAAMVPTIVMVGAALMGTAVF